MCRINSPSSEALMIGDRSLHHITILMGLLDGKMQNARHHGKLPSAECYGSSTTAVAAEAEEVDC
jgi:hypothetical protein